MPSSTMSLVPLLARALVVPESRVRKAAGLPPAPDPRENITTRPHLHVVRPGEQPVPSPRPRLAPLDVEPSTPRPPD